MDFATITIGGESSDSSDTSAASSEATSGTATPVTVEERAEYFAEDIISKIKHYRENHCFKFVGAGLTTDTVKLCPQLPTRLWLELDIVPLVLPHATGRHNVGCIEEPRHLTIDEQADAVVRKALRSV